MLKIKDNVDLKELEKFGFIEGEDGDYTIFNQCYIDVITVYEDYRILEVSGDSLAVSVLYDLITAGLVEKLEEE